MKYTKEERLAIGKRIYYGELSKSDAAKEFGITVASARDYMRFYRDTNNLPGKTVSQPTVIPIVSSSPKNLEDFETMSKEELIRELVKARINEARLKKGYEVKGDGSVILYDNKNTK